MSREEILVAGAGIAGLAAALALARAGWRVRVFEQAPRLEETGAGIQLGPNGARALEWLGVWPALEPLLVQPDAILIRDGCSGRRLAALPLGSAFRERFGAPYGLLHRADLQDALLAVASAAPGIRIETGCAVSSFAEAAGIRVTLASGATATGAALVGADGIRSTVRRGLLGDGEPHYAGQAICRALVPEAEMPAAAAEPAVGLWLCPAGHVVHYPLRRGRAVNLVAVFDSLWREPGWSAAAEPGEVADAFTGCVPELQELLAAAPGWRKWAAADRPPARCWGAGAVTLIGDAAHPVLPTLAQGAVMALEDAATLGHELARGGGIAAALRRYEAARRPRTARLWRACRSLARAYHAKGALRGLRNALLQLIPASRAHAGLAWLYRWTPPP